MSTCQTCGESFIDKKALRSVSSHIRPRFRRPFLLNSTDLPISILHSTKRSNIHPSDVAFSAIRSSLLRRLCARTKLQNTNSGVSYVASRLLRRKRFRAIGGPNIRHREMSLAQSNSPSVQCRTHPNPSTNAINVM